MYMCTRSCLRRFACREARVAALTDDLLELTQGWVRFGHARRKERAVPVVVESVCVRFVLGAPERG